MKHHFELNIKSCRTESRTESFFNSKEPNRKRAFIQIKNQTLNDSIPIPRTESRTNPIRIENPIVHETSFKFSKTQNCEQTFFPFSEPDRNETSFKLQELNRGQAASRILG